MTPTTFSSSSTTGIALTSCSARSRTASATASAGFTVTTSRTMTSNAFIRPSCLAVSVRNAPEKSLVALHRCDESGFVVVVEDAPVGQRQVGHEMMGADDFANGKIGDRRVHVRNEMQPARSEPGAFDHDVGQIVRDELADLELAVHAGNKLQVDLGFGQHR